MDRLWNAIGEESTLFLSLALILLSGFLMTRLTKKLLLPNVSGYIIAGILIGPHMLNLVPTALIDRMFWLGDIALAFIAFGVGRFFKREAIENTGMSVIVITLLEALLAGVLIFLSLFFGLRMDWQASLLMGAIATSTAPASTIMTIRQYHARGPFVDTLLQVVAFDDVICLLCFSVVTVAINAAETGEFSVAGVLIPILLNIAAMGLGALFGLLLGKLITPSRSRENRLILSVAMLLCLSGVCAIFDISPLLACMLFGTVYINLTKDKKLFKQIERFTPPVMSLFFIVSGMRLDVSALHTFGVVGVVYFLVRIVGKYAGAWLGCQLTHAERPIRNYLGAALVPQAGVAIGLAYLGQRILPPEVGSLLMNIILSSSVLYELFGPASAKFALFRSGAIQTEKTTVSTGAAERLDAIR